MKFYSLYRSFRTNMALDVNCTCNFSPPLYVASASCQSGIYGIPSGKDGGMVRTVVRYYQHFTLRLQVNYLAFTRKIYVAHATRCHICPKMTVVPYSVSTAAAVRWSVGSVSSLSVSSVAPLRPACLFRCPGRRDAIV